MTRRRAFVVQLAATVAVGGLLFIVAGIAQGERTAPPAPVQTVRPATEQEERQWELDRLEEELRQQQERAGVRTPSGPAGPPR